MHEVDAEGRHQVAGGGVIRYDQHDFDGHVADARSIQQIRQVVFVLRDHDQHLGLIVRRVEPPVHGVLAGDGGERASKDLEFGFPAKANAHEETLVSGSPN